jgi:ankyrin repeat protein
VNFLLAMNANVNVQDNEGFSPLHLSVISANARIIRRLLIYGAERKLKDKKGQTAYQTAMESDMPQLALMVDPKTRCSL